TDPTEESEMKPNYQELGLLVGFEIHQELDTHKLFCDCPSTLRDERPPMEINRRLRPTQSELGEIDRAALAEATKGKGFRYQAYPESVCLVELDEEPPHSVNEEAQEIALETALLLNAKPVDEAHVMRKTVIDGSNTAGFQRTVLVATDGQFKVNGTPISIPTICLEEDAARKMGEGAEHINYRLDRLGIPLVEIATGPDFSDPHTPAKAALYLGQLLRATGKVKRGIGTIRQDINISIRRGARQEIKGIQELSLISTVIEREVQRQLALLEIRDELKRRKARKAEKKLVDVTGVFSESSSKVIRGAVRSGGMVLAVKLPKFGGLIGKEIQPNRRFGTELADYARLYGGVKGIFHTDELPAYGISSGEVEGLRNSLKMRGNDAVIFMAGEEGDAKAALEVVIDRANQTLRGVPEETRRTLPDGNTEFMRPLPGAARMYPETDIGPIAITKEKIREIRKRLPELPERKVERFAKDYGLSENLARRISLSENVGLFEELVRTCHVDPTLVAFTLEETLVSLQRDDFPTENIQIHHLRKMFDLISQGKIMKDAVPVVLGEVAKEPKLSVKEVLARLKLRVISREKLKALISRIVKENEELIRERGEVSSKALMGIVMKEVRGRADGRTVHELLKRELKKRTG
ncbi:MAG: Glu-tRNA(Gln) amidotransferase subunit GatE, partial [Candidatus Hadarchaeota archaeon]|nr:Glu-tRNA(Gln) amidotransferase subunit GatE [Candidatus Hadarchaeota archaeon]